CAGNIQVTGENVDRTVAGNRYAGIQRDRSRSAVGLQRSRSQDGLTASEVKGLVGGLESHASGGIKSAAASHGHTLSGCRGGIYGATTGGGLDQSGIVEYR